MRRGCTQYLTVRRGGQGLGQAPDADLDARLAAFDGIINAYAEMRAAVRNALRAASGRNPLISSHFPRCGERWGFGKISHQRQRTGGEVDFAQSGEVTGVYERQPGEVLPIAPGLLGFLLSEI